MGSVEVLAHRVGVPVQYVAGLRLIDSADAPALLDALVEERLRVLGVEGFYVEGQEVVPVMEAILDLSGIEDVALSINEAKRFVDLVAAPGLFFELGVSGEVSS